MLQSDLEDELNIRINTGTPRAIEHPTNNYQGRRSALQQMRIRRQERELRSGSRRGTRGDHPSSEVEGVDVINIDATSR